MRSDLMDLTLVLHHQTAGAILVSETGDRKKAVWLPKAAVEVEETGTAQVVIVTLPERLAVDKRLV